MSWQYTPYALVSLMTAIVAAGLAFYALRRMSVPGARMGALFMAAVSLWGAADAAGLSAVDLSSKLFWGRITYLGIVVVPVAWWGFTAEYTGRERWITRRNLALLSVVPVLALVMVFTNESHHLFWSRTKLDSSGSFVALAIDHGIAFWFWCSYTYALLFTGAVLVISMLVRTGSLYSKQGGALLFGVLAPWLGNMLYLSGLSPVPNLDLTPFFLLLTGVAMVLAISRFGLLDVVPVARFAVVEEMADGVIVLDGQDRVLDLNPAARPLSKLPASEAIGLPADKVLSSEEVLRGLGRDGEDGVVGELRIKAGGARGEGQRDYEVTVEPLRKAGRRQRVRLIVARDVTRRDEKDLLFRLVTDNSSDIVSIYDRSGEFRYVSPSAERVLGYGPEEAIRLGNDPGIIHPEDRPRVLERREELWVRPGVNGPLVFRVLHKDGSWRHVEGVFNNLLDHPRVGAVVASWRDVTKRVEAEEEVWRLNAMLERRVVARTAELEETLRELAASEERYRTIFENAVEGIFQSTADGRMVIANPAMARIFGYASPEALISSVTDIGHQLYADPRRREELAAVLRREGAVSGFELRMVRRDGSPVWVSASVRTLYDESGRPAGYEGTLQDITGRVEGRRTLERRVAALTGIAASLTVDQPLKATLDSLASGVVGTTAALACSVYLIDPEENTLLMAGSCGLPEGYTDGVRASWRGGARHPALDSIVSRSPMLVRDGRRLFLDDSDYAPIHHFVREAPWDAIRITPLVAHGEALGTISAYYPPGEEPPEDETTFLEAVADQAAVAVENSRLFSAAASAATLQERQRLSRELHDSVSQALYGIALGSRTARTLLDRDPARAVEPLEYVLSLAEAGLAEMRALIFELRPEALESEGLVSALEKQAAALRARHEVEVRVDLCDEPDIPPESKEALYRVAQEALQNVIKHSDATSVDLSLRTAPGNVSLRVADDGTGFDPSGSFPGHLGLKSMRERIARLDGTLEIESAPGKGTSIRALLPPVRCGGQEAARRSGSVATGLPGETFFSRG